MYYYLRQKGIINYETAVSYALVIEDKDNTPATNGFTWVHWTVANITRVEVVENESEIAPCGRNGIYFNDVGLQSSWICSCFSGGVRGVQ